MRIKAINEIFLADVGDLEPGQQVDVNLDGYMDDVHEALENGDAVRIWQPKELRIFQFMPEHMDPMKIDFSILGLRKASPSYVKGRKTKAEYKDLEGNLVVRKVFSDVTDENALLTGLNITFEWYCHDESIGMSKTELAREWNKYEAETVQRDRRARIIDYLVAGAKGTPIEIYLTMIFDKYYEEVLKYKEKGSDEFATAVLNESDPTLAAVLQMHVTPELRVIDSIIGQLS